MLYTAVPPLLVRTVLGMWGYLGGSQRHGGMCWPLLFAEAAELKRTSTKCAAATAPLKLGWVGQALIFMKEIANKTCDFNAGWLLMLGALCVKIGVSRTASLPLSLSPGRWQGFFEVVDERVWSGAFLVKIRGSSSTCGPRLPPVGSIWKSCKGLFFDFFLKRLCKRISAKLIFGFAGCLCRCCTCRLISSEGNN